MKQTPNSPRKTKAVQRQYDHGLNMLKEKYLQSRILYTAKIHFKLKDKTDIFRETKTKICVTSISKGNDKRCSSVRRKIQEAGSLKMEKEMKSNKGKH